MAIQDMAVNYGLVPDFIEVEPNVGFKTPRQAAMGEPLPGAPGMAGAPEGPPPVPVDMETDALSRRLAPRTEPSLPDLAARYSGSTYAPELRAAAQRVNTEQAAFDALVRQAVREPSERPSQAEMYFRLAAAFGTPTKTGSFFESLGVVGKEVSDYLKENRATEAASRANRLKTLLESRKITLQAAREELSNLRTLATEEIKMRGAQSPAGKQAMDEGLVPGSPAFNRRVTEIAQTGVDAKFAQLNATLVQTQVALQNMQRGQAELGFRAREVGLKETADQRRARESQRLTPAEVKLKTETEDTIASTQSALGMINRAYTLNPNTFDASLPDTIQRKALETAGSKDPKLLRTRELENILGQQAIAQLKTAFGGNPTEGERKILIDLQGLGAKSIEERGAILRNAYSALKSRREREQRRLNDINAGRYRETTPDSGGE